RTGVELAENGEGFFVDEVEVPVLAELVCLTQNETSTGVSIPEDSIHRLVEKYPDKLFAVDAVSSCPYTRLDYSKLDCVFFSVQKCFGLPAGLGVMVVSERAMEVA